MPEPVDSVRAHEHSRTDPHGTHGGDGSRRSALPLNGSSAPSDGSRQAAAQGSPPVIGTLTISINATPELLRGLLSLIEASGLAASAPANEPGRQTPCAEQHPDSEVPPSTSAELCRNAERLLVALAKHRRDRERNRLPDEAWVTKSAWLPLAGMHRCRKDVFGLIDELLRDGYIEARQQGRLGAWRQYRATAAGLAYADHAQR